MKATIAKNAGFCFGVKRAVALVEDGLAVLPKPVRIYGHLVHNEEVVKKFTDYGIEIVEDLELISGGSLIITAHGISPKIKKKLQNLQNLTLLDTTCPKVLRVHKLAKKTEKEGRRVMIFGDISHREVTGIKGAVNQEPIIFNSLDELKKIKLDPLTKYGLVMQTTRDFKAATRIISHLKENLRDIKVFNTICKATQRRQKEARRMAAEYDLVLVVGSQRSSNTNRLFEISKEVNPKTYFVPTKNDLKNDWFNGGINNVGILAGASTPDWVIEEVYRKISVK